MFVFIVLSIGKSSVALLTGESVVLLVLTSDSVVLTGELVLTGKSSVVVLTGELVLTGKSSVVLTGELVLNGESVLTGKSSVVLTGESVVLLDISHVDILIFSLDKDINILIFAVIFSLLNDELLSVFLLN